MNNHLLGFIEPATKHKISPEVEEAFANLVPLFSKINGKNFGGISVHVLREWHQHVSIENVFDLLYNDDPPGSKFAMDVHSQEFKVDNPKPSELKLRALEFLYLIVETFKGTALAAAHFPPGAFRKLTLSSVSFHEFSKKFLAIKILLSCVKSVRASSSSLPYIPRVSLFKVYYIFIQKLIQKYPKVSSRVDKSLILCQSQLGKVTKKVFPNVTSKRLGRRGESKFHYIGLIWDVSMVDERINKLLGLALPQIEEYFKLEAKRHRVSPTIGEFSSIEMINNLRLISPTNPPVSRYPSGSRKPSLSYVDLSRKYPDYDCSPRIWGPDASGKLQHSEWAKRTMQKALQLLRSYKVDLEPFIERFNPCAMSGNTLDQLFTMLLNSMCMLRDLSAPKQAYSNLFLVILLLIFPAILASDQEISLALKRQLRSSLQNFISGCESEYDDNGDDIPFRVFIKILTRMVALSGITSSKTKIGYTKLVIKEMVYDLKVASNFRKENLLGRSDLEENFITSIITSGNAYDFSLMDPLIPVAQEDVMENIATLANILKNIVVRSIDIISMVPLSARSQDIPEVGDDVPYQVFRIVVEFFHKFTLASPLVRKLPMNVVTFIMMCLTNSIQKASFRDSVTRDRELSKETFKCWWIFSTMFQEYMGIISEVVAMSEDMVGTFISL
ncbi:hypothetical protein JCM33374_g1302 [Metschnikowia sp. JCM 33374]|nr:hypothetical protein JCM33374_g1302 [Metschnikowia sp. JCM 33374]